MVQGLYWCENSTKKIEYSYRNQVIIFCTIFQKKINWNILPNLN
jgi:hypothetical protein